MDFLYFLEGIRCPFLDAVMSAVTYLGSEAVFMMAALICFWCIDKKRGYFILAVGFVGTVISQFLKLVCHVPRPWVRDPEFTIVESARADAGGYSFPSGHTQNVVSYAGPAALTAKKAAVRVVFVVIILLTAFSRMYLGVHTPADVLTGLAIGVVLLFLLRPLFEKRGDDPKTMCVVLAVMAIIAVVYTAFTSLHAWPHDIDAENLYEGVKNGWSLSGACLGMLLAYILDFKYIHFETNAPIPAQIIKVVIGLALTVLIKTVLKAPLLALFGGSMAAHGVRYFIMVMFAAAVWPLTFKKIASLFEKK